MLILLQNTPDCQNAPIILAPRSKFRGNVSSPELKVKMYFNHVLNEIFLMKTTCKYLRTNAVMIAKMLVFSYIYSLHIVLHHMMKFCHAYAASRHA